MKLRKITSVGEVLGPILSTNCFEDKGKFWAAVAGIILNAW